MERAIKIISELYYPEESSTGFFVTGIAEDLAKWNSSKSFSVSVLCSQPTYYLRWHVAAKTEAFNGVHILRLAAPSGDKSKLLGRLWNFSSLTLRVGLAMFRQIKSEDIVVVLTNPPSLPLIALIVCKLKGAQPVLWVQDVYPDVLIPTGLLSEGSLAYRFLEWLQSHVVRRMTNIIVLGRDMEKRLRRKLRGRPVPINIIHNWGYLPCANLGERSANQLRERLGLGGRFIIQMSGNLGRTHGLEDLVKLAMRLKGHGLVHFLIFGWGAGRAWLEKMIESEGLTNVTVLDPCAKEELTVYLSCCDLFFLPFKRGMEGISVPSRMYNVMAAGNAMLAVVGHQSELALVVKEEQIGWVVEPGNIVEMAAVVESAIADPKALKRMRERSRAAAVSKYTRENAIARFVEVLGSTDK